MKLIFIITLISIFSCCQIVVETPFADSYYKLPVVHLPITLTTNNDGKFPFQISEITDSSLLKIFGINNYERPIGRLFVSDNYFVVLSFFPDDVGTPVIKTYSKSGSKVDSLWIFDDRPATTIGLISRQYATVKGDRLIQFTDSSFYLDSFDNIINSEAIKKTFYFASNGHILHH